MDALVELFPRQVFGVDFPDALRISFISMIALDVDNLVPV
jgi:hypothetical protein